MKHIKKYLAILAAFVLLFAQGTMMRAADEYTITVTNSTDGVSIDGKEFIAYKVFDVTYNTTTEAYVYSLPSYMAGYSYTTLNGSTIPASALIDYVKGLDGETDSAEIQAFAQTSDCI